MRRHAFTFVELLLAIGLSMILLLVALLTFRSVTTSIQRLEAMAAENKLIRSGYFQVTKDLDYWHSHADPAYPYLRAHMSAILSYQPATFNFKDSAGNDVLTHDSTVDGFDTNSIWDNRPFRPVNWDNDPRAETNPVWQQAHDPAAWYRNHMQPNLSAGTYGNNGVVYTDNIAQTNGSWIHLDLAAGRGTVGDTAYNAMGVARNPAVVGQRAYLYYTKDPATDAAGVNWNYLHTFMPDFAEEGPQFQYESQYGPAAYSNWQRLGIADGSAVGYTYAQMHLAKKRGWQPWHLVGDYANLSNCEGRRPAGLVDATLDEVADKRSRAVWHAFAELGPRGVIEYCPLGDINLIQAASVNETTASYEGLDGEQRADLNFSKGEIPWSLNTGDKPMLERAMDVNATRPAGDEHSYGDTFLQLYPMYNRLNYAIAQPTYVDGNRESIAAYRPFTACTDFGSLVQDAPVLTMAIMGIHGFSATHRFPHALILPRPPRPDNLMDDTYDMTWPNWDTVHPLVPVDFDYDKYNRYRPRCRPKSALVGLSLTNPDNEGLLKGWWKTIYGRYSHQTYHLPSNREDDPLPNIDAAAVGDMAMYTAIRRMKLNGWDRAKCEIVLQNPQGDPHSRLVFSGFSTSFRGARHYWGRRSDTDGDGQIEDGEGVPDGYGRRIPMGDGWETP